MPSDLYVLLDANIIVEAHEQSVWTGLTAKVTVVVPSEVCREAAFYFDPGTHEQRYIHLETAIQAGIIRRVEASAEQIQLFLERFDSVFVQRMDAGEAEALALLYAGVLPDHWFCTADGPAIRALSLLEMSDVGISFEALLQRVGLKRTLKRPFTDAFFKQMRERGVEERIRGEGLRPLPKKPPSRKRRKHQ